MERSCYFHDPEPCPVTVAAVLQSSAGSRTESGGDRVPLAVASAAAVSIPDATGEP